MIAPISTPTVPQTTDTDPPIAPVLSQSLPPADEVFYPDSDGQPMADNTKQFRWITVIQYNLSWLFAQDPAVFVAGDLLWYPVQGNNKLRQAPDVMVVFGVPKGDRGSYQQWKENDIAPQVVFEILSPGNTLAEMTRKLAFYSRYGVEEYYIYDPDRDELTGCLQRDGALEVIEEMVGWVSPRLGITFKGLDPDLQLLRPDGTAFTSYEAVSQQLEETSQQLEAASQQLEATSQQLEAASQQLEATSQQLEAERDRADRLAAQLRALGIDPT